VVDAYDDPNAVSDLTAYRASLSSAQDPNTGLADTAVPPLCTSTITSGCTTFTKINETGGTSYPAGNTGWAEEISLDLDMVSAVCPACNVLLVEASSNSSSDLAAATAEAETFHPAAIGNSYGSSEYSSEIAYNSVYTASPGTAITVSAGDAGYGAEFPAAAPGVTAVGGTTLSYSGTGSKLVWASQSVWSDSGSGCSSYETMPTWQDDQGVYSLPADCAARQVADISADANPATGVAVYDTYGNSGWLVFGGTSVSAQIISAAYGLAAGTGTEQSSPQALYTDANGTTTGPTPGLVPVTSGSNATCGDYLCNAASSLLSGYNGPGGLGTLSGTSALTVPAATSGTLSFSPGTETLVAGTPAQVTVQLSAAAPSAGTAVTLSSSAGGFSTSQSGPFTTPLIINITGGSTASAPLWYQDNTAGAATATATATSWAPGNLQITVDAGPLASITLSPATATVAQDGTQTFTASGADTYGNPVSITPSWATTVPEGTMSPATGSSSKLTVGTEVGTGTVTAAEGTVSGSASVTTVAEPALQVTVTAGALSSQRGQYRVPLTVAVHSSTSGDAVNKATTNLSVFPGTTCTGTPTTGSGTTGKNGQVTFTFSTAAAGSWCATAAATAPGYINGSSGQTIFTT
jgi:hypothetical protein